MPIGKYDRKNLKVQPTPDYKMTKCEKSYLAGIIDGEGSIMVIHHPPYPKSGHKYEYWVLRVSIANNDKRLIEWLLSRLGGGVSIGISKNPKWNDTYQWRTDSKQAKFILENALPYLILKKEQALLALELIKTHKLVGRKGHSLETFKKRKSIAENIKLLNRRGKH